MVSVMTMIFIIIFGVQTWLAYFSPVMPMMTMVIVIFKTISPSMTLVMVMTLVGPVMMVICIKDFMTATLVMPFLGSIMVMVFNSTIVARAARVFSIVRVMMVTTIIVQVIMVTTIITKVMMVTTIIVEMIMVTSIIFEVIMVTTVIVEVIMMATVIVEMIMGTTIIVAVIMVPPMFIKGLIMGVALVIRSTAGRQMVGFFMLNPLILNRKFWIVFGAISDQLRHLRVINRKRGTNGMFLG